MNDELTVPTPRGYTPLTPVQLERLHADLHPARVATRDQGGRNLSYLEAFDVRATLIRIFGYGNFSVEVTDTRLVHESQYTSGNNAREQWRVGVICTVKLTIHQTGAVYSESAAASQSNPDYGEALDFAVKTAESDALKRCATNLGSTFGLSLYNNGTTQDVVKVVYSPDQYDVVQDIRAVRGGGEDAAAAHARIQARLKTRSTAPEKAETPVEEQPAQEAPQKAARKAARPAATRQPTAAARRPRAVPTPADEPTEEPTEPALAVVS
jgi:recombination DNA repair RAD52 pathway protein